MNDWINAFTKDSPIARAAWVPLILGGILIASTVAGEPPLFEKYIPYPIKKAKHVVQKITNNEITDEDPLISGSNLAWERFSNGDQRMMFRKGGVFPEKDVSGNTQYNPSGSPNPPQTSEIPFVLSGSQLVWLGHLEPLEPSNWANNGLKEVVMHFDGSDYSNTAGYLLPNNDDYHYETLAIGGTKVAWAANYPAANPIYQDFDIYSYELGPTGGQDPFQQLSSNQPHDAYPAVSSTGSVAWMGNFDGTEPGFLNVDMFRRDGATTTQLNTAPAAAYPKIAGNRTAWFQLDGTDLEVVLHDGSSASVIPNTGPVVNMNGLQISESYVAWLQDNGQKMDVRLYDGNSTNVVWFNSAASANYLDISGHRGVWTESEPNLRRVIFYDGSDTTEIFSGDFGISETKISGANLVWEVRDRAVYDSDSEIYAASYFGKWAWLKNIYAVELDLKDLLMTGSYMQGADLTGADLSRTYLYEALLVDAILSSATVEGTDFSNADLTGVIGLGETVGRAKYSLRTIFPEDFDPVALGWENLGVVPEPGALLLAVLGLFAVASCRRRRAAHGNA